MGNHVLSDKKPYRVGFLLIENFTLIALASAIQPLRMANQLTGRQLYSWQLVRIDSRAVTSSDGIEMVTDTTINEAGEFDLILVVAGVGVARRIAGPEVRWLKSIAKRKAVIGAVCTGAYVLARANLLNGYSCSAHWECLAALQEEFPDVRCNNQLFTFDRDRLTCTGGDVPMHMMMALVAMHQGTVLANAVSDMFVCDRIRQSHEPQRLRMESQLYANKPKLAEVIQLMEANIEEPIELSELAYYAGLSRRHLERLFLGHLSCTPSRYYLKLRLERARQLLLQTSHPIVEIASMCGFVSATHFSRCYRKYMGKQPKAERFIQSWADPVFAQLGHAVSDMESPSAVSLSLEPSE